MALSIITRSFCDVKASWRAKGGYSFVAICLYVAVMGSVFAQDADDAAKSQVVLKSAATVKPQTSGQENSGRWERIYEELPNPPVRETAPVLKGLTVNSTIWKPDQLDLLQESVGLGNAVGVGYERTLTPGMQLQAGNTTVVGEETNFYRDGFRSMADRRFSLNVSRVSLPVRLTPGLTLAPYQSTSQWNYPDPALAWGNDRRETHAGANMALQMGPKTTISAEVDNVRSDYVNNPAGDMKGESLRASVRRNIHQSLLMSVDFERIENDLMGSRVQHTVESVGVGMELRLTTKTQLWLGVRDTEGWQESSYLMKDETTLYMMRLQQTMSDRWMVEFLGQMETVVNRLDISGMDALSTGREAWQVQLTSVFRPEEYMSMRLGCKVREVNMINVNEQNLTPQTDHMFFVTLNMEL